MLMITLVVAFTLGVLTALVWVWRFYAVEQRRPLPAAWWDVATMGLAYTPFQLWADAGNNPWVLITFIVGNGVGTYLVVRRGR